MQDHEPDEQQQKQTGQTPKQHGEAASFKPHTHPHATVVADAGPDPSEV
jgi:hypothetical protein